MQIWVGALGAVLAVVAARIAGRIVARWASGSDAGLPAVATTASAGVGGLAVGAGLGLAPALPAFEVLATGAAILVGIDLRLHRLPDRLTASMALAGVTLLAVAAAVDNAWPSFARAVVGGVALFGGYLLLYLAVRSGLGAGDVKLAGVLGLYLAWLGWSTFALGTFAGFIIGGLVSLTLLTVRRATMQTRLPFGPSMVAGALLAIAIGDAQAATLLGW